MSYLDLMGYLFDRARNERILRRLLRTDELPDPVGFDFVEQENGYSTMEEVSEAELERRWREWHAAPRRAHIAHEAARRLYAAEHRLKQKVEIIPYLDWDHPLAALTDLVPGGHRIDRRRARRRLARARRLVVKSHYIHPPRCDEFEGYFDLGDGIHYPITFVSRRWPEMVLEGERMMHRGKGEVRLAGSRFRDDIIVDVESLDVDSLKEVITEWYVEKHSWTPGHWTQPDGLHPEVVIEASFEQDAPAGIVRAIDEEST